MKSWTTSYANASRALRVAQGCSGHPRPPQPVLTEPDRERSAPPCTGSGGHPRPHPGHHVEPARGDADDDMVTSPMIDSAHSLMRWPVMGDPGMNVVRACVLGHRRLRIENCPLGSLL